MRKLAEMAQMGLVLLNSMTSLGFTVTYNYSCTFHQLTGRGCSTRLRHYYLIWTLIIQLGQGLTRSAYRDKTVVVVVLR